MKRDEHGLMLVEVLCAAGIIGLGIAGLMTVVPISSYGIQEGNRRSTATFLAEQRLEQVRSAPWTKTPDNDCLGLGTAGAPSVPVGASCAMASMTLTAGGVTFADEPNASGYAGYQRTVRVRDCGAASCAGMSNLDMRLVTVTVSYVSVSGVGTSTGTRAAVLNMVVARR